MLRSTPSGWSSEFTTPPRCSSLLRATSTISSMPTNSLVRVSCLFAVELLGIDSWPRVSTVPMSSDVAGQPSRHRGSRWPLTNPEVVADAALALTKMDVFRTLVLQISVSLSFAFGSSQEKGEIELLDRCNRMGKSPRLDSAKKLTSRTNRSENISHTNV